MKKSYPTVTDQFCGAGGTSTGATLAGAEVKVALNHWPLAIETHNTNFPDTYHDCTDISACDPRRYPSTDILIAGPECTNHSLAKGKSRKYQAQLKLFGKVAIDPSEERSRATMWDVPRFAEFHDYNFVIVENVIDARNWRLFDAWIQAMTLLDYSYKIVYFNSQFAHPTPQSRDRMYVVFWKKGNKLPDLDFRPPAYCNQCYKDVKGVQSWKKPGRRQWGRYQKQYVYCCPECANEVAPYYYAAINCIDWSISAERIGERKRPLKQKTLERIRYGLKAYGAKPLIVTAHHSSGINRRVRDAMVEPMFTQPASFSHAIASPFMVETGYNGGKRVSSGEDPMPTQTTQQTMGLVSPGFLSKQYGGQQAHFVGMDDPTGAITTIDHHALIQIPQAFIAELRNTSTARSLDSPLSTVTATGSHHALINTNTFLAYYYGRSKQISHITDPTRTITAVDRVGVVQVQEEPKLEDCTFRMLQPHEIGAAMAFPDDYVVLGNKRQRVRQYGNAVTPPVMKMLVERCLETLS